jgi:hypothetical protein
VPAAIVGVTIVSIGTTLPEMITGVMAVRNRQTDVAIGNAIGSCLFHAGAVFGIVGLVAPPSVDGTLTLPIVYMGLLAIALVPISRTFGKRVSRLEGGLLLASYAGFLVLSAISATRGGQDPAHPWTLSIHRQWAASSAPHLTQTLEHAKVHPGDFLSSSGRRPPSGHPRTRRQNSRNLLGQSGGGSTKSRRCHRPGRGDIGGSQSGRPGSNRRHSAWEADVLPLNYARGWSQYIAHANLAEVGCSTGHPRPAAR